MDFNTAKAGLTILISSGMLDKDYGIFQILSSNFVNNSEGFCDWANRVYFSFLIGQIKDYFVNNPKYFLIYFKEECPDICNGEILKLTNGLIDTPNLKYSNMVQLFNVL
tara:strand:- start:62 stop:388 length:327 start_codon:yes stop_codon:yes gene_type:complete